MEISEDLKNFINKNLYLIDENTKESWEEIYKKLIHTNFIGEFTETILSSKINDPADILSYIPPYYLNGRFNFSNYVIPDTVKYIGERSFWGCRKLTDIKIPNSVLYIGACAFTYCSNLQNLIIGDSVTAIGNLAFSDCSELTSVLINSNSLNNIGEKIFSGCKKLKEIYYNGIMDENILKLKGGRKTLKIICKDGEY